MSQLALSFEAQVEPQLELVRPCESRVYAEWVARYLATGDAQQCERLTWRAGTNPKGRNWVCAGDADEPLCAGCEARGWWMAGHDRGHRFAHAERCHYEWHVRREREVRERDAFDRMALQLEQNYGSAKAGIEAIRAGVDGLYEDHCYERVLPRLAVLDCTHHEAVCDWVSRQWCPVEPGLSREAGGAG